MLYFQHIASARENTFFLQFSSDAGLLISIGHLLIPLEQNLCAEVEGEIVLC